MSHAMIDATAWYQGYIRKLGKCLYYLTGRTGYTEISFMKLLTVTYRIVFADFTPLMPYVNFYYGNLTLNCATGPSNELEQYEALFRL